MPGQQTAILTDVGTNELEVVEFYVDNRPYAINVAKVREIIRPVSPMTVPESHPCIMGVFRNREDILPLVDLGRWLDAEARPEAENAKVIVAEFNAIKVGFLVHGVNRIHRVSWRDLESPSDQNMLQSRSSVGFIRLGKGSEQGERIVFLLDFERIVTELQPRKPVSDADKSSAAKARRRGQTVLVAEDSMLIRKVMVKELESGGYSVLAAKDGQEAWEALDGGAAVDVVISDIEMPRMDGHHLTRRIRSDGRFASLPLVLYSSMIYEEMRRKGESLGVDAQICKPDLPKLLGTVDGLLASPGGSKRTAPLA